jgi:hypothetical protein
MRRARATGRLRALADASGVSGPAVATGLAALALVATGGMIEGTAPAVVERAVCTFDALRPHGPTGCGEGDESRPPLVLAKAPGPARQRDRRRPLVQIHPPVVDLAGPRSAFLPIELRGRAGGFEYHVAAGSLVRIEPGRAPGELRVAFRVGARICRDERCVPLLGIVRRGGGEIELVTGPGLDLTGGAELVGGALLANVQFWTSRHAGGARRVVRFLTEMADDMDRFWSERRPGVYRPPDRVELLDATVGAPDHIFPAGRQIPVGLNFLAPQRAQALYRLAHGFAHAAQAPDRLTPPLGQPLDVAVEAQAECYAGYWFGSALRRGLLTDADFFEMDHIVANLRGPSAYLRQRSFDRGFSQGYQDNPPSFACPLLGSGDSTAPPEPAPRRRLRLPADEGFG